MFTRLPPLVFHIALADRRSARVQAANVGDIAGRAPSVTFSQNTGLAQLTIRGIGTNAVFAGADPTLRALVTRP